ncbi:MAG: folate-binding protein YgfZ [Nocardiopsaceae bacterium]|nr:folate-binding protein YgfZ [Nocardiopsaceae bacterium]
MLDIDGAVEATAPDEGIAAHYGDPAREQRALAAARPGAGAQSGEGGPVLVDRSNRGVVRITGPDRLTWLHSLTSQHLERLVPGTTTQALVLNPQGHIEHHLTLTDDGGTTWAHVEPGTAPALAGYLDSMRFMMRVEVTDMTPELGVLTVIGPGRASQAKTVQDPIQPNGSLLPEAVQAVAAAVTEDPFGISALVPRDRIASLVAELGRPVAGIWGYEAARIAAHLPRPGLDTDHRTLPHEVGLIGAAVHLDKGCYRGQETVARIHNLGHPPRRLVFLHLDGSADRLPAHGAPVTTSDGTTVGFAGSSARHYELGPIGLGLIKRSVAVDATLLADGIAAAQEVIVPPDAGAKVKVAPRREFLPPPPASRKLL